MRNRVYYGEYSLAYWIELILAKKITLPKYQRYFVWEENRMIRLVDSLKHDRFIPPVTIGAFKKDDEKFNYIIDGQQRLTSIFLAYLGIFPNKEGFKAHLAALANGNEQPLEDGEDPFDNVLEWNFEKLTAKGKTKGDILGQCEEANYKRINLGLDADFFKNKFLGFSYIVPAVNNAGDQQKYYTKVFREINVQGVKLQEVESRRAMYFLSDNLDSLFEPAFASNYGVELVAAPKQQMDFVRYLCFMCAYKKHQNVNKVARGYSYYVEKYIEKYIHSIVDEEEDAELIGMFGKFTDYFADGNYSPDMERLSQTLDALDLPKSFPSIINMDTYFFGLIYHVLLMHKSIAVDRKDELKTAVEDAITELKATGNHAHAPAQFQYMRARILKSVEIYEQFVEP